MQKSDMHSYYNSIKALDFPTLFDGSNYHRSITSTGYKPSFKSSLFDKLSMFFLIILLGNVIPVVPYIIFVILKSNGLGDIKLWSLPVPLIIIVQISGIALSIVFIAICESLDSLFNKKSKRNKNDNIRFLSYSQKCFADIYKSFENLKTYQFNNIDEHLAISIQAINSFIRRIRTPISEVKFVPGFELSENNNMIITLIKQLSEKVEPRIKGEKDIPIVVEMLEEVAFYIFSNLPEIKTFTKDVEIEELRKEANKSLVKVLEKLDSITIFEYSRAEKVDEKKNNIFSNIFDKNLIARFFIYLVILSVALTGITYLAIYIFEIKNKELLITIIIPTAFAAAAALANFNSVTKSKVKNRDIME